MYLTKNQKTIIGVVSVLLVILGVSLYLTIGQSFLENQKIDSIQKQTNSFIENKYTESIKSSVTVTDVKKVKKELDELRDGPKKQALKKKIDRILEQASIQTDTTSKLADFQKKENASDLNRDDLVKLVGEAQKILNEKIRTKTYREGYEILGRYDFAMYVQTEADKISIETPGQYYTVQTLNKLTFYKDVKDKVNKILESKKKEMDSAKSATDSEKKKQEEAAIEEAKESTTYAFTEKSSSVKKLSPNQFSLVTKVTQDKSLIGKKFIGVEGNKVIVYSVTITDGDTIDVKEVITFEASKSKYTDNQVFTSYEINTNNIKVNNGTIGTNNSTDVVLSTANFESLKNNLK